MLQYTRDASSHPHEAIEVFSEVFGFSQIIPPKSLHDKIKIETHEINTPKVLAYTGLFQPILPIACRKSP